jgi:predicted Zn-dependent protease
MSSILSRADAEALVRRTLAFSTADATRVNVASSWSGNTRFAGGEITTAGGTTDTTVTVSATVGKKRAAASTNVLDDASLKRTVDLAQRLAALSPDDPELMPELGAQQYATPAGAFEASVAELGPEARALAVGRLLEAAKARGTEAGISANDLFVGGFLEASARATAVGTSAGLFAYHTGTDVSLSNTVRTPDGTGSGYASQGARDWKAIDPVALGRRAADKGIASRNPQAIEPGAYTVVLEPRAVADILGSLTGSFNARSTDEGRSPFSVRGGGTKVGQKIADPRVTLWSDPADPMLATAPFDAEGQPVGRTTWIENGMLKGLAYSRYWAQRTGQRPTGGGGGGGGGGFGGPAGGLHMAGTDTPLEQLVAGTERGILVTRFWYIRFLDQRTVMLTGLTRDGTFLIEKGKVTRPLRNFRFNESPLFMLNKLDAIGRAERVDADTVVPALKVKDFQFTSLSDAV